MAEKLTETRWFHNAHIDVKSGLPFKCRQTDPTPFRIVWLGGGVTFHTRFGDYFWILVVHLFVRTPSIVRKKR